MANHYIDIPVTFGVLSLDGMTGALTLVAGTGISIVDNPGAGTITISSSALLTAITSINGDTTSAQTLSVGTAGTDFAIVDAGGGSHVFNLPTASAVNRGALSSADWTTFNNKQSLLSIGTYDSQTPSSNGLVLLSSVLYAQSASATVPGMVSTGSQTLAGSKTFSSLINADGGIDRSTVGTLTIGATNSNVINIGNSGATVNIQGTTIYENTPQLLVSDPLITVNHGGGAGSGQNSGIQIEEASLITGYAETSADRNSWILKAPNTAGIATITPGVAGITLNQSSHNPVTIGSPANGLSVDGSQVVSLGLSSTSTTGALSSTDWNTFNNKQAAGNYITALTGDVTASGPGSAVASISSTTVTGKVLTGYVVGSNTPIAATDSILQAFQKTQGQINATTGAAITALTGDGTATGPGSVAFTLATVNSNVGSFGSSTAIPSFTVNGKGLITAASTNVVIAPAGTLTGTTLASNVVSSSLTSVGTITTGVWNGTTIAIANGGTGQTTANAAFNALSPLTTKGDIIGFSTINDRLPVGTNAQVLTADSTQTLGVKWASPTTGTVTSVALTVPTFLSVSGSPITTSGTLAVTLSGTALPIANGGTGQTTAAAAFNALNPMTTTGDLIYESGTNTASRLAIGSTGNVLTVTGGVPVWAAPATSGTVTSVAMTVPTFLSVSGSPITSSGTLAVTLSGTALPVANGGTGQTTLTNHGVLVGQGTSGIAATAAGSAGQVLQSGGASADPTYSTATYPSTTTINQILYSSSANVVAGLATTNTGALVTSSAGVPSLASGSTANRLLRTDGTTVSFAQAALATDVSGTLPVANGGTGQTTYTNGQLLIGNTTGNTLAKATLTAGNGIGITNGTGTISIAVSGASGSSFITSGTTYTTPSTITSTTTFKFILVGGGGGGGGSTGVGTIASGGGAGGCATVFLTGLAASTGYTMAIGAAGAGGSNAGGNGANGGDTTISINATTYTAAQGVGAVGEVALGASNGGAGGGTTNATVGITGQQGGSVVGVAGNSSGVGGNSGMGFGLGGAGISGSPAAGVTATGFGGGGGGGRGNGSTGGAGTQGCILVQWWN